MLASLRTPRFRMIAGCLVSAIGVLAASSNAQQPFSLAHGGTVFDAFTLNGDEIWTVEDGGRIRHRTGTGSGATWNFFSNVPDDVRDLLYRVDFLDDGSIGWAVGLDGWVLTLSPTAVIHPTSFQLGGPDAHNKLWDIRFTDPMNGWLLEEHGLYHTSTGGAVSAAWSQNSILILDKTGSVITPDDLALLKFYSLDIAIGPAAPPPAPPPTFLGLMCAQPGLIFRSVDGFVWQEVFDVRDLCGTGILPKCMTGVCNLASGALGFEPWDVEIQRHDPQPLALMVGGFGANCGMVFRSTDLGLTWTSEPHECTCTLPGCHAQPCSNDPAYKDDGNPAVHTDTWRLDKYHTLYSVSIFDGDGSAIAGGYSGQHLVRNPSAGVWLDRSSFSNRPAEAPDAVTLPMYATAASSGSATNGIGMIGAAGGFIRHTTDGGQSWVPEVRGDPYRSQDVCFISSSTGWAVGQWFRIAKSTDAGTTWDNPNNLVSPTPVMTGHAFLSIAMNPTGFHGVAVGQPDNLDSPATMQPMVYYSTTQDGRNWDESALAYHATVGTNYQNKDLRDVCWAGGSVFWTAGQAGFIYKSIDDGETWNQVLPPGFADWTAFSPFDIRGLAFTDATSGVFVGSIGGVGKAFVYRSSGVPAWIDVSPSAGLMVKDLTDVDILFGGSIAYAVGVKMVGGLEQGVILTCDISQTSPLPFAQVPSPPTIVSNVVGDDLQTVPVLKCVALTPNGDVWTGGECGRVWRFTGTQWGQVKSQTDAHIRGLSFPLDNVGFGAALSTGYSAYSVVRFP